MWEKVHRVLSLSPACICTYSPPNASICLFSSACHGHCTHTLHAMYASSTSAPRVTCRDPPLYPVTPGPFLRTDRGQRGGSNVVECERSSIWSLLSGKRAPKTRGRFHTNYQYFVLLFSCCTLAFTCVALLMMQVRLPLDHSNKQYFSFKRSSS